MKINFSVPVSTVKALKIPCAKPDEQPSRPYLRSILLQVFPDRVYLIGTDGYIMAASLMKAEISGGTVSGPILFPLPNWPAVPKKCTEYAIQAETLPEGTAAITIKAGNDPEMAYSTVKAGIDDVLQCLPDIRITGEDNVLVKGDPKEGTADHYTDTREIDGFSPAVFAPEYTARLYTMQKAVSASQTLITPRGNAAAPFMFTRGPRLMTEVFGLIMPLRFELDAHCAMIETINELKGPVRKTPETPKKD